MTNKLPHYVPEAAIEQIRDLLSEHHFKLKIVNQRKTKHGDFRKLPNGNFQITLNNSLNKYQFLITLLHEIAHFIAFNKYQKIQPHGKEWKHCFQHLMLPFLNPDIFPDELLPYVASYIKNPKASTDSDTKLSLVLKKYSEKNGKTYIFELPLGSLFYFKENIFRRGNKRRIRIECVDIKTKKSYLFNPNVEVDVVKNI
jgi:hypothetical protein